MALQSVKNSVSFSPNSGIVNLHKTGCLTQGHNRCSSFSNQRNVVNKNLSDSTTKNSVPKLSTNKNILNTIINKNTSNYAVNTVKRNMSSCPVNKIISHSTNIPAVNKEITGVENSMRSDAFVEALLSEDECMGKCIYSYNFISFVYNV